MIGGDIGGHGRLLSRFDRAMRPPRRRRRTASWWPQNTDRARPGNSACPRSASSSDRGRNPVPDSRCRGRTGQRRYPGCPGRSRLKARRGPHRARTASPRARSRAPAGLPRRTAGASCHCNALSQVNNAARSQLYRASGLEVSSGRREKTALIVPCRKHVLLLAPPAEFSRSCLPPPVTMSSRPRPAAGRPPTQWSAARCAIDRATRHRRLPKRPYIQR